MTLRRRRRGKGRRRPRRRRRKGKRDWEKVGLVGGEDMMKISDLESGLLAKELS